MMVATATTVPRVTPDSSGALPLAMISQEPVTYPPVCDFDVRTSTLIRNRADSPYEVAVSIERHVKQKRLDELKTCPPYSADRGFVESAPSSGISQK